VVMGITESSLADSSPATPLPPRDYRASGLVQRVMGEGPNGVSNEVTSLIEEDNFLSCETGGILQCSSDVRRLQLRICSHDIVTRLSRSEFLQYEVHRNASAPEDRLLNHDVSPHFDEFRELQIDNLANR
jgi:hypothetical protein